MRFIAINAVVAAALLTVSVNAVADPHQTNCRECCNVVTDKLRYVHHALNKSFRDLGTIKFHVANRSSPWTGRAIGGTRVTTIDVTALNASAVLTQGVRVTVDPEFNYTGIPRVPFLRLPTSVKVQHIRTPALTLQISMDLRPVDISTQLAVQGGWAVRPNQLPYVAGCAANPCLDNSCHDDHSGGYVSIHFPWDDGRQCSTGSIAERVLCALSRGFECSCGPGSHGSYTCILPGRVGLPLP